MKLRVGFASDHGGFALKQMILSAMRETECEVADYGAFELNSTDDYPDFVIPLAKAVSVGHLDRGIAICTSGIGACIAANKISSARAGLIHDAFSARQGVEDDDMNIICLGARLIEYPLACELIEVFLKARFSGAPRFTRRLDKGSRFEQSENYL